MTTVGTPCRGSPCSRWTCTLLLPAVTRPRSPRRGASVPHLGSFDSFLSLLELTACKLQFVRALPRAVRPSDRLGELHVPDPDLSCGKIESW